MSLLQVSHLSFSFPRQDALFDGVELELHPGWYGLVGPNGSGKTTLMRLLEGALAPDTGVVRRVPEDARALICQQTIEESTPAIESFAASTESLAFRWRGRLALSPEMIDRWPTLSPGERKRWQIGAALFASPDILLLDEPTNHLDVEGSRTLSAALRQFSGIGILVSHDRALLDEVTGSTLRLVRRRLEHWSGGYSTARASWEHSEEAHASEIGALKTRERTLAKKLQHRREEQAQADRSRSARHRMKNARDHDGSSMGAKARADWAEARASRTVETSRNELERIRSRIGSGTKDKSIGRSVFAEWSPASRTHLFHLDGIDVRAGDALILHDVRVAVGREDRIHIAGANGAGKTTLLSEMMARSTLPEERVLHLPQELSQQEQAMLLERVRSCPRDVRGRILSLVAALGVDPDPLLASGAPSPGEARKLALALGLGRHAWVLILDEPTNHLDLDSIERLERALAEYPGALLLVSHDRRFAEATTTIRWSIKDGRVGCQT